MPDLASCGNDCAACPRYTATLSGDDEQLREVAALWQRAGWRDRVLSPDEIACRGCVTATWCRYGLRECAQSMRIDHCGRCPDYPCDNLSRAWEATDDWARVCQEVCSPEEFARLDRAFFQKKANLDRMHRAWQEEGSWDV